jgi:branched-subunit amino acid aminotransferase/4-amino-4-deoxychorismate lyase
LYYREQRIPLIVHINSCNYLQWKTTDSTDWSVKLFHFVLQRTTDSTDWTEIIFQLYTIGNKGFHWSIRKTFFILYHREQRIPLIVRINSCNYLQWKTPDSTDWPVKLLSFFTIENNGFHWLNRNNFSVVYYREQRIPLIDQKNLFHFYYRVQQIPLIVQINSCNYLQWKTPESTDWPVKLLSFFTIENNGFHWLYR